ncbi:phosphate acyltransferase PlsX [Caldalkalibacillus salinus]|uniref:phosphate acyltransferase PlsX n=1 Tax=Caldalkalibacillus salinus TaxID=2803787 RepID=UPI001920E82B|nr:phosphate acyltransferase PlsX [Caldalkalibacillus salinus]
MKIALDAMGGDHAPKAMVEGALLALEAFDDIEILLVGQEDKVKQHLPQAHERLSIVNADEVIETDEEPVRAVRKKKDSSLVKAAKMVKDQEALACISAGNTGAYMTAGLLVTGRLKGIERPALATYFPTVHGHHCLVLDVGANVEAKASHLHQYAKMGKIYAENVMGLTNPSVALLNVGTEEAKGNELTKQTFSLLKDDNELQFIGNVEARDVPFAVADVVVCDGFSGNVLLKTAEGAGSAIFTMLKKELTASLPNKLATLVLKPSLKRIKKTMDYTEYGGAPLLGLNGGCIKAHGSSNEIAIKNAVGQARKFIKEDVLESIRSEVQKESDE